MVYVGWFVLLLAALFALAGAAALFSAWTARRVETAVPPLGHFIEIDGARLHYVDEGTGPAIVLIHGLAGNMRNLTYGLLDLLKDECRVIFVDRPGSGYSERLPGASAHIAAQAATMAAFLTALKLERPMLVGHSLGGALALAVALDYPEKVGGLALVAPATHPQDTPPAPMAGLAIASPFVRRLVAWILATPLSLRFGAETISRVFHPDPVPLDFATCGGGLLGLRPANFVAASADLTAIGEDLPALVARYHALDLPVGILYGDADTILDYRAHGEAMVAKVPGLTLDLVEGCGHMLPISAPSRVCRLIKDVGDRMAERGSAPYRRIEKCSMSPKEA